MLAATTFDAARHCTDAFHASGRATGCCVPADNSLEEHTRTSSNISDSNRTCGKRQRATVTSTSQELQIVDKLVSLLRPCSATVLLEKHPVRARVVTRTHTKHQVWNIAKQL